MLRFAANKKLFYSFLTVYGIVLAGVCYLDMQRAKDDQLIEDAWPAGILLIDNLVCTFLMFHALYRIRTQINF